MSLGGWDPGSGAGGLEGITSHVSGSEGSLGNPYASVVTLASEPLNVLGMLMQPLSTRIQYAAQMPDQSNVKTKEIKFLVVLDLPVPVHVHAEPMEDGLTIRFGPGCGFDKGLLPERYRAHPYHASDVCILPDLS